MLNKKPLTIEEIREKFLYLSGDAPKKNLNESVVTSNNTSKLLKYEKMADGKVYGIVQEGQKFYVKVCTAPTTNTLNVSDFTYLGGSFVNERMFERFESYNKALNRFHGKKVALNETFGRLNEECNCDKTETVNEADKDVVNTNDDSKKRSIKVTFDNGDTINTEINGTEDTIKKYYIGKSFNLGNGEKDNMVKATKVEFLGDVNEGEVNEEIPLNKDIDAKKGEVIVPAPVETPAPATPVAPELPVAAPTEAKPEGGEPVAPAPATDAPVANNDPAEPAPIDNSDLANYNPENPAPAAPSTDSAPMDAPVSDVSADAPVSGDSTDSESGDTVSEIQSLLGKLGAEFRKLPDVDATTAKSAINNIISSTKSGIEKLDDKDKEDIKKRIDKNGEKIDEEVESTDDELDAETINEIKELCGVDAEDSEEGDAEKQLNEAIKTPYGRFIVKKLIKEELGRYQDSDINETFGLGQVAALLDGKKFNNNVTVTGRVVGKDDSELTIKQDNEPKYVIKYIDSNNVGIVDMDGKVLFKYNLDSADTNTINNDIESLFGNSEEQPVQESKYQKYLASKKTNLDETDDDSSLEVGKEYKTDSNLGGTFNVAYKGKGEEGKHNFEVSRGEFKGQKHSVKPEDLKTYLVKEESTELDTQLNEAIKTPYGKFLMKKIIKEEFSRYQDNIIQEGRKAELGKEYTHFAIDKASNKIITGWEYKDVDNESIKEYCKTDLKDLDKKPSECKILTRKAVEKLGLNPNDSKDWNK
jgi:hypothetical protein